MNHRIVKMNFNLNPSSPEADRLIWESSCFIDSEFLPSDLEYLNINPRNRQNNRLIALDDGSQRLVVFSDNGDLLTQFNLIDPSDSVVHAYHSFASKINNDNSISIYLADGANSTVRLFRITRNGDLRYVNELNIGDRLETSLTDLCYSPLLGLWAVETQGPRIYHIAENLSGIIREINGDDFNPRILFHPYRISLFPERLVVLEETGDQTGIFTVAFDLPYGLKEPPYVENVLPLQFDLEQNYPNPFNSQTIIRFDLPDAGQVELVIYNILGQKVATLVDQPMSAGTHSVIWDGRNADGRTVSSGVYLSRLRAGDKAAVKKLVLLK